MKNILSQLGYSISESENDNNANEYNILIIQNNDGSIRWAWPNYVKKPLFLKFYNVDSFKSKLFSLGIKIIFLLNLQERLFKNKTYYITKNNNQVADYDLKGNWVLFSGTVGPNQKGLLYDESQGFIKIALNKNSEQLLNTEANTINRLYSANLETINIPRVNIKSKQTIQLNDISENGIRSNKITKNHINALIELNEISGFRMPLGENEQWINIKNDIAELLNNTDDRMPKGMIRKLDKLIKSINETTEIQVSLSHGDFTPWNMFIANNKLNIYDWELANPFRPLGFDLFHFIIQQGVLVEQKNWKQIKSEIEKQINCEAFSQLSKFKNENIQEYLKLYLIFNTAYYLKLYTNQPVWHTQVNWLLNVWNDALSCFSVDFKNQRELILMDTFDFLSNKKYGTIKFKHLYPENLSEFSDIDMCIEKQTYKELVNYLKNHPLVNSHILNVKSFMATMQVFCLNGSILSLDLIWNVKRKNLQLLDTKQMLSKTFTNYFGVKMLDVYDNARYIGLFYKLNNANIPTKYNYYQEILSNSINPLDVQLYPYFVDEDYSKAHITKYIKQQKQNVGINGLKNSLYYILDTLKSIITNRGMIITFSGVDGAGKSTVIDNLKYKIEKQLRKKVIVLRHRPSILPILSSWTKGKQQAEKDATNSLPRTGNNKSFISSLLRFGYYYTDYVLGQFIIQLKYVSRGYVVIYDRYYFDFINDSKRSNIILPKFILKSAFMFLIKPKFNFFLYADSEVILSRKKELDKETIESLTKSYINQFDNLKKTNHSSKFITIKNNKLNQTLDTIFQNITAQAA